MVYTAEKSKHVKTETSKDGAEETKGKKALPGDMEPEECFLKAKELVADGKGKPNTLHLEYPGRS